MGDSSITVVLIDWGNVGQQKRKNLFQVFLNCSKIGFLKTNLELEKVWLSCKNRILKPTWKLKKLELNKNKDGEIEPRVFSRYSSNECQTNFLPISEGKIKIAQQNQKPHMSLNRRNSVSVRNFLSLFTPQLSSKESNIQYSPIESDDNDGVSEKKTRFCCVPCCGVWFLPRWLVITSTSVVLSIPLLLVFIFVLLPIFVQVNISSPVFKTFSGSCFWLSIRIYLSEHNTTTGKPVRTIGARFLFDVHPLLKTNSGHLLNVGPLAAEISETNITVEYNGNLLGRMIMPSLTAQVWINPRSDCIRDLQQLSLFLLYFIWSILVYTKSILKTWWTQMVKQ